MNSLCLLVGTVGLAAADPVETKFSQVAPVFRKAEPFSRSVDRSRAVVLMQGIRAHPFSNRNVAEAERQRWQKPGSKLVKTLAGDADVFAFAYGQNVAVDRIAGTPDFGDNIRRLKQLGYAEIVLVGHSAGGLVARQFVEDQPETGVTKVIQVCAPNGGSFWGVAKVGVRKSQEAFLTSLSKAGRQQCLAGRAGKRIPEQVEFVCLVGQLNLRVTAEASLELNEGTQVDVAVTAQTQGDGVVSSGCQWTADLQKQGIPAVPLQASHFTVMRSKAAVKRIARLVREKQPRWDASEVAAARKSILGRPMRSDRD